MITENLFFTVKHSKWTKTLAACLTLYYTYLGLPAVTQKMVLTALTLKARF